MSSLSLAIVLLVAVIAVSVATRPAPRRRRPAPGSRIERDVEHEWSRTGSVDDLPHQSLVPDAAHRNRWDRRDLILGIGRDFATPDPRFMLWPESGSTAR